MGVFKWLRRERVTVTSHHSVTPETPPQQDQHSHSATHVGTIRTEEYKRDLAEFQARRSTGPKELPETPVKNKCGRHSLPVSCTNCATDHDTTFNYEKKSAVKYKKKSHKRVRSAAPDDKDGEPTIQFLFQNQVFMPGNIFPPGTYSEPQRSKRHSRHKAYRLPEVEFAVQKHIDFSEDQADSPPLFYKNNSLPFDVKQFLKENRTSKCDEEEVDGLKVAGELKSYSRSSSVNGDDSEDKLWEVMSELKHFDQWADEQLQSQNTTKSDDSKSETSAYGLPIASASNLDVDIDREKTWNLGKWGVVPVQIKRLAGVTVADVKRKRNTEINILRKCRHPNIILLMGLYPDVLNNIHIICERCIDSLFGILHIQGRILSAQTAVHYALDIANALVFLRMQGYIHTELSSMSAMVTSHDAAKLADLGPCVRLASRRREKDKGYEVYSPEPQYVNIQETRESNSADSEPLLSKHSSETYLVSNAVSKPYKAYRESEHYRWQAPELFEPDEGSVHPCAKSDVYSLCLILWECCNATIPWKVFSYEKLKESYTSWRTGIRLPQDGTYPGSLLALLQSGLSLSRTDRIDLSTLQNTLQDVKRNLDELEYIIIPARLSKKKSNFSSTAWDTNSPTDDSECLSPLTQNIQHKAVVHAKDSSSESSEKDCSKSDASPLYETIRKEIYNAAFDAPDKCYISDDENVDEQPILKYEHLPEKVSSACSTPIAKLRARIKDIGTPGALHRSDSTEYCSILSPDHRNPNDDSNKDQSPERFTKLSRSFTPQSYKPLHIKVPECHFDSVKAILKEQNDNEQSSYNFDIKNYSLPTTPIARSNKLRRNAWLSGELSASRRSSGQLKQSTKTNKNDCQKAQSAPETPVVSANSSLEKDDKVEDYSSNQIVTTEEHSPASVIDSDRDAYTGLRRVDPPLDFSPETDDTARERTSSWSFRTSTDRPAMKYKVEEDVLAKVNVKPLVAIHERWIYEANRKTGRSMSLPEDNRSQISAVKPASHCVDTLQKSLPQLNLKRAVPKPFRTHPVSPSNGRNGSQWEQFCQAREVIAKNVNFTARDPERFHTFKKDDERIGTEEEIRSEPKIDQATDTRSIEEYIRDLIRKEFQYLLHEISDDASTSYTVKSEEILNKGVANIVENLKNGDETETSKKDNIKSFSRVKINGNNKPLLQITFSRSGENSLQVLDNCVNVTICDAGAGGRERVNVSMEDTLTGDDVQVHSLKRCQAFNAIQEARSTEDLYIDDDLSTQMQENFGGKVKLIPLHGSLHEILCEKEDECCLIKVKQENGCDTIYFRCDNSDTESRDAIDGIPHEGRQDTVVFKRSISLIEERIQRVFPKEKRAQNPATCRRPKLDIDVVKTRPKSEILVKNITRETRVLSNSSPSLMINDQNDEVEVNIENVMCYQDSSSDECLKCQMESDDFELLERKIEEDIANSNMSSLTCGCLEKISEENLSVLNEEGGESEINSVPTE